MVIREPADVKTCHLKFFGRIVKEEMFDVKPCDLKNFGRDLSMTWEEIFVIILKHVLGEHGLGAHGS